VWPRQQIVKNSLAFYLLLGYVWLFEFGIKQKSPTAGLRPADEFHLLALI
jgi:hypothetical protein